MIEYLTDYHDLIDQRDKHPGCFPTEASLCIDPKTALRIKAKFDQAIALAQSDTVRPRVEKASLSAYRAMLSAATMDLKYEEGLCKPHLDGVGAELLEQYATLCAKHSVSMENEHTPNARYLDEMRKLQAGMRAVALENDLWRVLILPESNAKVIEMTYKPTGRDVVQPARALDRFRFEDLTIFWSPERMQINLEMIPRVKNLEAGQQASYAYEVRYLDKAPPVP